MVFLNSNLSPDPLTVITAKKLPGNWSAFELYPHALVRIYPTQKAVAAWGRSLRINKKPEPLAVKSDPSGRAELVLDFGTEIEGRLQIDCKVPGTSNIYVTFGESIPEAEAWGGLTLTPPMTEHRHFPGAGKHTALFDRRGFRFARILAHDMAPAFTITGVKIHAEVAFQKQPGGFTCSDKLFQRVWQASLYTARVCTRREGYWDGIKRDRVGWYGDARVTQETTDAAFFDPRPAEAMLANLETDAWANQIPGYSFDAIAMLRQLILAHGLDRAAVQTAYKRMAGMLAWAARTQTTAAGLLTRNNQVKYQFGIGFVDWSVMPVGGRLEELGWLQCKYLEGLRHAAQIARWLGRRADAERWSTQADRLARTIMRKFWQPGAGFHHTLNLSQKTWDKFSPDNHYPQTYLQKRRLGPSGPSRQSNALAVWAGLCADAAVKKTVLASLDQPDIAPVCTPYFAYYEQCARAECGDSAGAIMNLREYFGSQIELHDSATVWESFEPEIKDFRQWGLHNWQKSLCHAWSSGSVGLAQKYLLGVAPAAPGFREVALMPSALALPWALEAVIPTPLGGIEVSRKAGDNFVRYRLPKKMIVAGRSMENIRIEMK